MESVRFPSRLGLSQDISHPPPPVAPATAISNPSMLVVAAGSRPNSDDDGGTAVLPARDALRRFTRGVRTLDPGEEAPLTVLAPPLLNEDPEIDILRRCLP